MHRRIDGGSPEPAFAGSMMIRQLLVRDSLRCRVVGGVVDPPTIGVDYRSEQSLGLPPAHGLHLASASRSGC
jgi:hypothetical protein